MTDTPKKPIRYRMKRPLPPEAAYETRQEDIKKTHSKKQLELLGAVALAWNQAERNLEYTLCQGLDLPLTLWHPVAKRINGLEGIVSLVNLIAATSEVLDDDARHCISNTMSAFMECKGYRDAAIHSVPFSRGTGVRVGRQAKSDQILLTKEALSMLYERIDVLRLELSALMVLYGWIAPPYLSGLRRLGRATKDPDPLRELRERDVPKYVARVQLRQKQRQSLPPLPEFPDKPAAPSKRGSTRGH